MTETLREKAKRHPRTINRMLAGGLVLALVLSAALTYLLNSEQQKSAEIATQSALLEADRAKTQSIALIAQAQIALDAGDTTLALQLAIEANRGENPLPEAREMLMTLLYAPGIRQVIPIPFYQTGDYLPWSLFSRDGKLLIMNSGGAVVRIDTATGRVLNEFRGTMSAISADGQYVVDNSACRVYDAATGDVVAQLQPPSSQCMRIPMFSPAQDLLFITGRLESGKEFYTLYSTATWQPVYELPLDYADEELVTGFWSSKGRFYTLLTNVTTTRPERLLEWHLKLKQVVQKTELPISVYSMLLPANSDILFMMTAGGEIVMIDLGNLAVRAQASIPVTGTSRLIELSPDRQKLLVDLGDSVVGVVDTGTLNRDFEQKVQIIQRFKLPGVVDAVFSSDSQTALVLSLDGLTTLDFGGAAQIRQFEPEMGDISYGMRDDHRLFFAPDNALMLNAGNALFRLDNTTYQPLWKHGDWETSEVYRVSYAPAVERAAYYNAGEVFIVDALTGDILNRLSNFAPELYASGFDIALSPDGKWLALDGYDRIEVYEVATGKLVWSDTGLDNQPDYIRPSRKILFDSTGTHLAAVSSAQAGILTLTGDAPTFAYFPIPAADSWLDIAFASDDRTLLLLKPDSTLISVDTASRDVVSQKTLLPRDILACGRIFPAADKLLLCSANNHRALLMTLSTGEVQGRWYVTREEARWLNNAVISSDGHTMASQQGKGIQLWQILSDEELLDFAQTQRYLPDFTCQQREQYRLTPCSPEISPTPLPPTWTPAPFATATSAAVVVGTFTPTPGS